MRHKSRVLSLWARRVSGPKSDTRPPLCPSTSVLKPLLHKIRRRDTTWETNPVHCATLMVRFLCKTLRDKYFPRTIFVAASAKVGDSERQPFVRSQTVNSAPTRTVAAPPAVPLSEAAFWSPRFCRLPNMRKATKKTTTQDYPRYPLAEELASGPNTGGPAGVRPPDSPMRPPESIKVKS